jgi:hypothetical protein
MLKLALLILLSATSFASQGTIKGTVVDPSGAVVQNAHVRILNGDGETAVEGVTGKDGSFILQSPTGDMSIAVFASGFDNFRKELQITDASAIQVDVKLAVGCSGDFTRLIPKKLDLRVFVVEIHHWGSFGCPESVYRLWGTGQATAFHVDCRGKTKSITRRIEPSELMSALQRLSTKDSAPVCRFYPGGVDAPRVTITVLSGSEPLLETSHDEADQIQSVSFFEDQIEKLVDPDEQVKKFRRSR